MEFHYPPHKKCRDAFRDEYLSCYVSVCRFRSSSSGLLLATDVAARGLDIPAVEHVIHYQVPKDPDVSLTPTTGIGWESLSQPLKVVFRASSFSAFDSQRNAATTFKSQNLHKRDFQLSVLKPKPKLSNHKGQRQSVEPIKTRRKYVQLT